MGIFGKIANVITHPWESALFYWAKAHNVLLDIGRGKREYFPSDLKEFEEIKQRAIKRTDISDHLPTLFSEAMSLKPSFIVELGVRGGESTFVFERVSKLCKSKILSIDLSDCSKISKMKGWNFIQADDIKFAKEFKKWCAKNRQKPSIDLLFIDTSHEHQHTVDEINSWFPFLAKNCKVVFHDSNVHRFYKRKDGSLGVTGTPRGVTTALQQYFGVKFDETVDFVDVRKGWTIKHYSYCCGMTVLER